MMTEILNTTLPADLIDSAALPGVQPLATGQWLRVEDSYAEQVAYRRALIDQKRACVLWQDPKAVPAIDETHDTVLGLLPALGFHVTPDHILCPDGALIQRRADSPLAVLGRTVQEDICILEKRGDEHVLTAAILCFPASWTLAEKAGRPLRAIHAPVQSYAPDIALRVQRLFDGVHVGRPIWRNNMIWYDDPDLYQPRSETAGDRSAPAADCARYQRVERQCIVRLPKTNAVVFSIHSYVLRRP